MACATYTQPSGNTAVNFYDRNTGKIKAIGTFSNPKDVEIAINKADIEFYGKIENRRYLPKGVTVTGGVFTLIGYSETIRDGRKQKILGSSKTFSGISEIRTKAIKSLLDI